MNSKRTALGITLALSLFAFGAVAEDNAADRPQNPKANPGAAAEKQSGNTVASATSASTPIPRTLPAETDIHLTDLKIYPSF